MTQADITCRSSHYFTSIAHMILVKLGQETGSAKKKPFLQDSIDLIV